MKRFFRDEDGAVAVEAALLLPFITIIMLGIVEFGLLFRDVLTVQTAARDAARSAAAHSREADFDTWAIDRVTSAMNIRTPAPSDRILIYKAEGDSGLPVGATSARDAAENAICPADTCAIYRGDATGTGYEQIGVGGWDPLTQNACPEAGREYVGVIVSISHPFITGKFATIFTGGVDGKKTVLEKVVMRLEPRPPGETDCKPAP